MGANSAQTWTMLQALQWRVQNEVVVGTTTTTPVNAPGSVTITPASMAHIAVGSVVQVDSGIQAENVTVTAVSATTFTATFTTTHTTTPYALAVSPFSLWLTSTDPGNPGSVSDAARFGANTIAAGHHGSISNAIYIGFPKDPKTVYPIQASISLLDETVYRRNLGGGKIWHETPLYVVVRVLDVVDWYQAQQTVYTIADQALYVISEHAELPDAPVVQAMKEGKGSAPTGYFQVQVPGTGFTWYCWATFWWARREWFVTGGIVP